MNAIQHIVLCVILVPTLLWTRFLYAFSRAEFEEELIYNMRKLFLTLFTNCI